MARRTTGRDRILVKVVAGLAGAGALFAEPQAARFAIVSALLRVGFAVVVTLAGSRARRWTWLVFAGLAVAASSSPLWLAVGAAGLVVAFAGSLASRNRIIGALAVGLSVQSFFHLPNMGFLGASALYTAAAAGLVCVSAYSVSPRVTRKRARRAVAIGAGVMLAGAGLAGVAALAARSAAAEGEARARDGISAVRDGRMKEAAGNLDRARASFGQAHDVLDSWWARPAMAVPLVAQQLGAAETLSRQGESVAAVSAETARKVDYESMRYESGRIDVGRVRDAEPVLASSRDSFRSALNEVEQVDGSMVFGPLRGAVVAFRTELERTAPQMETAAEAARIAPGLLGGDGERAYLVLFTTPAEERGLGGFVGSYALLVARDGQLTIAEDGPIKDLNEVNRAGRTLAVPSGADDATRQRLDDYLGRYGRFRPAFYLQDITFSPDLPSVADVAGDLYPQVGGRSIDGVMAVDPYGLAALLDLTGPIKVEGIAEPLGARNAADFLIRRQYFEFTNRAERKDALELAGRAAFDKLVHGSLPWVRRLSEVLSPAVEQGHLSFFPLREAEEPLFDMIGASGRFGVPASGDFLSVRTQNHSNSKIDVYLHRRIDYEVHLDVPSGTLNAKATVTLRNDAPSSGAPDAVIGSNDRGLPPGTNSLYFSFYTRHPLRSASIDGKLTGMESQRELGAVVYSHLLTIGPGQTVKVELDLHDRAEPASPYELTVAPQPMVNADEFHISVDPGADTVIRSTADPQGVGFAADLHGRQAIVATSPGRRFIVGATFSGH